jgi:hypothetical protein
MTDEERKKYEAEQESEHLKRFRAFLKEDHPLSRPLADWEMRILGGFGGYKSQAGKGAA